MNALLIKDIPLSTELGRRMMTTVRGGFGSTIQSTVTPTQSANDPVPQPSAPIIVALIRLVL